MSKDLNPVVLKAIKKIESLQEQALKNEITAAQFQSEFNDIIRNLPGDPGEGKITSYYTGVLIEVEGPDGNNVNSGAATAALGASDGIGIFKSTCV